MLEETAENLVGHVADRLSRGIAPALDDVAECGVEHHPELAFHFIDLLNHHYRPNACPETIDPKYEAALALLCDSLTRLRFAAEKQRNWAVEMVANLQRYMVTELFVPEVGHPLQHDVLDALKEADLEILPELKDANQRVVAYYNRFWQRNDLPNLDRVMADMKAEGVRNVYDVARVFMPQLRMLPDPEDQIRILEYFAGGGQSQLLDLVGLMLLHPDHEVRVLIPDLLVKLVKREQVSPETLCRMVAVRNWLPAAERPALDDAIREARLARLQCQSPPRGRLEALYASAVDGAGGQVVWLLTRGEDCWYAAHILIRTDYGVRETVIQEIRDRNEVREALGYVQSDLPMYEVKPSYLELVVDHFIAVGHEHQAIPPIDLLGVAELLGGMHWGAHYLEDEDLLQGSSYTLEHLVADRDILNRSDRWTRADSVGCTWFEDDDEVGEILETCANSKVNLLLDPEEAELEVLARVLEPRREHWARCFRLMAFLLKSLKPRSHRHWRHFVALAEHLRRNHPLEEMPIMVSIAAQTLNNAMLRERAAPFGESLF